LAVLLWFDFRLHEQVPTAKLEKKIAVNLGRHRHRQTVKAKEGEEHRLSNRKSDD